MDKDKIAIFAQGDQRWARHKIGSSGLTLKGWGCTITSTCRALFILSGQVMTPQEMEQTLSFTDASHPQGAGLILWDSFNRIGLKAKRGWNIPEAFKKGTLIELNYNPRHWVCFESLNTDGKTIQVMDPLKADIVTKKVSEISGYTYLNLIDAPKKELTAFEKEVLEATEFVKAKGWSNGERPNEFLTRGEFWVTLKRLSDQL